MKYEDLVASPEATLRKVAEFLDVPYSARMLSYDSFKGPSRDPLKFPQNFEATRPIHLTSVGRWRRDLADSALRQILPHLRPYLDLLEYEVDEP